MDSKITRYDIKDNGDYYENLGGEWVDAADAIEIIKALEAENAALRAEVEALTQDRIDYEKLYFDANEKRIVAEIEVDRLRAHRYLCTPTDTYALPQTACWTVALSTPKPLKREVRAMKTDIEYAALVMGERVIHDCNDRGARITGQEDEWNSLHDDGDSRRLEIACRNWVNANKEKLTHAIYMLLGTIERMRHQIGTTAEQWRTVWHDLAVAIGKVIDGGGE
jgi:hypothetical protein